MQAIRLRYETSGQLTAKRIPNAKRFHGMIFFCNIATNEPNSYDEYLMAQAVDNALDFEKSSSDNNGIIGHIVKQTLEVADSGGGKHIVNVFSQLLLPEPIRINGCLTINLMGANLDSEVGVIVYIS